MDTSKHSPETHSSPSSGSRTTSPLNSVSKQQEKQDEPDSTKVKPSFGKKKSFAPPTSSKQSSPQPESKKTSSIDAKGTKTAPKKPAFCIPKKSKTKLGESSDTIEKSHQAAESASNTDDSSVTQSSPQAIVPSNSEERESHQDAKTPTQPASSKKVKEIKNAPKKQAFSIPKKAKAKLSESSNNTEGKDCHQPSESGMIKPAPQKLKASIPSNSEQKENLQDPKTLIEDKENVDESTTVKSTTKKAASSKPKPLDPKKAAAKEEKEKKRLERERAKLEKEEAKREKERLKEEKKLEQERKKAEREQKKMEKELKKMEKLQVTPSKKKSNSKLFEASKPDDKVSVSTTGDSLTSKLPAKPTDTEERIDEDEKENGPNTEQLSVQNDAQETEAVTEQNLDTVESLPDNKSTPDKDHPHQDTNAPPTSGVKCTQSDSHCENVSNPNTSSIQGEEPSENHCDNKTDQSVSKPQNIKKCESKKRKPTSSVNNASAAKRFKPDFKKSKSEGKTTHNPTPTIPSASKTKSSTKRKTPAAPHKKSPRSKPNNYSGPVWVQCDSCEKWRRLLSIEDPSSVPDHWTCSMNDDSEHAQCSTLEEVWSDLGDSQEFVESPYVPGSLVWAKMDGYPW